MNMRFGSVSMMAATAAAILGFNTLSMHVSAERSKVEKLQSRIAADLRDIRALEAELRTRARLPVLQTWNDNVLAMSAPTARQFADSPVQLAAFAPGAAEVVPGTPAVQLALATTATPVVQTPGIVKAAYEVPAAAPRSAVVLDYTEERAAKTAPAKAAEVKTAKTEPKQLTAKPAAPVQIADARPKPAAKAPPKADSLDALVSAIDSAAAVDRGGFRKVAMQ
jgi:hypothetical protein